MRGGRGAAKGSRIWGYGGSASLLLALLTAAWLAPLRWGWHGLLYALAVQVLLMWWALLLVWVAEPALQSGWFRVRPWEAPLYRRLGVYPYMRLLRAAGWERFRRQAQGFDGTRASLRRYERATREAEFTHALLGLITLGLAARLWADAQRGSAGWLLLSGAFFHLYPVMLQRTLRSRLQRLGRLLP